MSQRKAPDSCPVCGEDLPPNALACPECGADYNSGWRDDADSIDVSGAEFDYEEFAEREFASSAKPAGISRGWWICAILVLLAFVVVFVLAGR